MWDVKVPQCTAMSAKVDDGIQIDKGGILTGGASVPRLSSRERVPECGYTKLEVRGEGRDLGSYGPSLVQAIHPGPDPCPASRAGVIACVLLTRGVGGQAPGATLPEG